MSRMITGLTTLFSGKLFKVYALEKIADISVNPRKIFGLLIASKVELISD
nr:hypothetical protein [uncultured Methanoregula sp.]